ncbi:MAG TPA: pseudouridine synthase [Solirubrobacteraceae bacterium]|jgi:23S rRNA pseudouridine2605 synthase
MRLAKYLAHAGVASRRAAEAIICEGRVQVDGKVVFDPAHDVEEHSDITVDARKLAGPERRVVYAVNKPLGVVSTARDTHGRPTVVSLIKQAPARLYPVGRLDADSSGLILLTNDGELAHRLTHPSFEVPKTYLASVTGGPVGEDALRALRGGVTLEDGLTAPARVRRLSPQVLELTIHEGRNRQVRRMCQAVGHPVRTLQRVAFGSLKLGDLGSGAHRLLGERELRALRKLSESPHAPDPGSS